MSRVTCAISGLRFSTEYLEHISIPHTQGYFHPIFACSYKQLHYLYTEHCQGKLAPKDSYLLFLAFLHSSDQIAWKAPVSLDPNTSSTKQLIENNLSQLIEVLEKTGIISHPSFYQPSFVVTYDNNSLAQIPNWIRAWKANIISFHTGRYRQREVETLQKVENRLSKLILGGEPPEKYAYVIADWACKASEFPVEVAEKWKLTILSCFNITKMFNTPLSLLKDIKDYCECNIEAGSIHFHSLIAVLKEGISRHVDYLGGSTLALGYTLLPVAARGAELKNQAELAAITANAPSSYPVREEYPDNFSYLKAKLAFNVASNIEATARSIEAEIEEETDSNDSNETELEYNHTTTGKTPNIKERTNG